MAVFTNTELKLDHKFDPVRSRHFLNGAVSVLHCHHFTTLYCQLADDAEIVDGKALLANAAEETFAPILRQYFQEHGIEAVDDRIAVAEQYYAAVGMGILKVASFGNTAGRVVLTSSHVDEGWKAKWGERDAPVNFITQGYVAALFAAVSGHPVGSFQITEEQSIVSGAETSIFRAVRP
jgi:hypothetical protein